MVLLPTRARRCPARPSWWPALRRDLPQPPGQPPAPHARWLWPAAGGHAGGRRDGVCAQWVAPPSPQPGRRVLHTHGLRPMGQGHGPRLPGLPSSSPCLQHLPKCVLQSGQAVPLGEPGYGMGQAMGKTRAACSRVGSCTQHC